MRDLDQRTEGKAWPSVSFIHRIGRNHFLFFLFFFASLLDLKGQIDSLARDYTANARTLSSEQKLSLLRQIQQSYGKCKEFGDDKVQLAMQTYEMVCLISWSLTLIIIP